VKYTPASSRKNGAAITLAERCRSFRTLRTKLKNKFSGPGRQQKLMWSSQKSVELSGISNHCRFLRRSVKLRVTLDGNTLCTFIVHLCRILRRPVRSKQNRPSTV